MVLYSYKKEDESDKRTVADLRTDGRKFYAENIFTVICCVLCAFLCNHLKYVFLIHPIQ